MFQLIDITIDKIFFSINWKNYFDRSILVISMTVLVPIHAERNFWAIRHSQPIQVDRLVSYPLVFIHLSWNLLPLLVVWLSVLLV